MYDCANEVYVVIKYVRMSARTYQCLDLTEKDKNQEIQMQIVWERHSAATRLQHNRNHKTDRRNRRRNLVEEHINLFCIFTIPYRHLKCKKIMLWNIHSVMRSCTIMNENYLDT